MQAPGKPTLLVYGHHDVQPVDPLDEWVTPPFEPAIRDGRMWGRGVVDDKGQVHIHVKAIEAFLKTAEKLPINLKLIVEGEEEIGSENLDALLRDEGEGPRGRLRLRERHGHVRARHPVALRRACAGSCTSRCGSTVPSRTCTPGRSAAAWRTRSTRWRR